MHGFLNINKPPGLTSHDVVARVRRLVGRKVKVGHAGTLDPAATGVLPVAIGYATRLIEYVGEAGKGYIGLVHLGRATSTDDAAGEIVAELPVPHYTPAQIEAAVAPLRGTIMQVPPAFSALHVDGKRAYDRARAGETVVLAARPVQVDRLEWEQLSAAILRITVDCGKGTYIRALARDIGAHLGCGGHLDQLVRTAVGAFRLEDAVQLDALSADPSLLAAHLHAPELAVAAWPVVTLDPVAVKRIVNGLPLTLPELAGDQARAHAPDGALLALLRRDGAFWRPAKVFTTE